MQQIIFEGYFEGIIGMLDNEVKVPAAGAVPDSRKSLLLHFFFAALLHDFYQSSEKNCPMVTVSYFSSIPELTIDKTKKADNAESRLGL